MEGCTKCLRAGRSPGEGALLEYKSPLRAECAAESQVTEVLKGGSTLSSSQQGAD